MTKQNQLPTLFDRTFPFGSLFNHSVGMDEFFERVFDDFLPEASSKKYPPYNIRKDDEHTRTIEMALAGYSENDIEITVQDNILSIVGNKIGNIDDASVNYVYKGLAARKFERKFVLAEHSEVTGATMEDGMLNVTIQTKEPEKVEVKRISVNAEPEE